MTTKTIAIIGSGPTGIYTLLHLLKTGLPLAVTLYEKDRCAGIGMPYSPEVSNSSMLANIASIEIPPIVTTYLEWLQEQPSTRLATYGLDSQDLDDRQFTPRLLLGEYFRDQLLSLVDQARSQGHSIDIRETSEVLDIIPGDHGMTLRTANGTDGPFDRVVVATGHQFPDEDATTRSYFPSPWSGLIEAAIPAVDIGIMGTSLSSIDAAMAVVNQHGRFRRRAGTLSFDLEPASANLHIVMMSRSGILPEADFYCPIPYEPLTIATAAALTGCFSSPAPLDAAFDLIRAEIMQADPAFALKIGLGGLDVDSFADAYFATRTTTDPFKWARANLDEVEHNKAHMITVAWRYALLRMHEQVEDIVPDLSDADRIRFDRGLKKVFVDNYAAVPSESIRRILALRDAGLLSILPLGEDYDMIRNGPDTVIVHDDQTDRFDVFIDARGQKPLGSQDLPFPTLRRTLLDAQQDIPHVARDYSLLEAGAYSGRLCLAAIPYLMRDRPFVQGITACADIAEAIAGNMASGQRRRLVS